MAMTLEEIKCVVYLLTYNGKKDFCQVNVSPKGKRISIEVYIRVPSIQDPTKEIRLYKVEELRPVYIKMLTPSRLVRQIRDMLVWLQTHEVNEQLEFNGERIFDPHEEII